jgi:hypothetical protein
MGYLALVVGQGMITYFIAEKELKKINNCV